MKRARFYCENCRKEVRWDAKVCPHCGRFFSAVKCPSCGFTGKSDLFVTGCPSCGYAGVGGPRESAGDIEAYPLDSVLRTVEKKERRVPPWLYPAAIITLIVAFILLVVLYVKLPG